jgi:MYXO-CTERM domain-containing protein
MSPQKTLLSALALGLGLFGSADALAWTPLDNGYPVWQNIPVTYKVNQSTFPASISGIAVARIDQGFADWGGEACTFFSATNLGNTASKYNSNDNQNILHWISSSWPGSLGDVNSVIGVTPVVFSGNTIYDADIVFNDVGFCWNDSGSGNCVDTQAIVTHEEGHFLGLGHSNSNGATMEPFYSGPGQGSLAQDDKDGVCALYPVGGAAASSAASGGSTCDVCVNNSAAGACSGAYDACGASQECINFYDCLYSCADQACVDACVQSYPTGAQIYVDLIDCVCTDCSVECSAECGGSSSSSTTSTNTSSNSATTSTTSGETTAASTSSGVGGSGATGAGGSDVGSSTSDGSTGSGGKKKKNNNSTEVGGCAVGSASGGTATLAALIGLTLALAGRRRRARR